MTGLQVLLVAGTHGNESNGPWLVDQWLLDSALLYTHGVKVLPVIGNPEARAAERRYLDRDLNRSFLPELMAEDSPPDREVRRAQELLSVFGPEGLKPCQIVIDLHSTTSAMGSSLVVYGRRPADLALASLIQARLGLPVYLYESDASQQGFLVEHWPCGLVLEIGPVPQSLVDVRIVSQTLLAVEVCCEVIAQVQLSSAMFPDRLVVHRHLGSLDLPRDGHGRTTACIHEALQGRDWQPLRKGDPLFLSRDGEVIPFEGADSSVPVFINEAAYAEKHIAMSLTERQVLSLAEDWPGALKRLVTQ